MDKLDEITHISFQIIKYLTRVAQRPKMGLGLCQYDSPSAIMQHLDSNLDVELLNIRVLYVNK